MGALRAKMERDLVVRGLSERTGRGYLRSVAGVARHYGRAPDTLTVAEVETYLVHLRQVRQLTWESLATVPNANPWPRRPGATPSRRSSCRSPTRPSGPRRTT